MSMGSEQSSTQTQNASRMGWEPAMMGLENTVIPGLTDWASKEQEYTGPSYLGPNNRMRSGSNMQRRWARKGGPGQRTVQAAHKGWEAMLDPSAYMLAEGAYNPLDTYASQVGRNLDENVRSNYFTGAVGSGHTGGYSSERAQADAMAQGRAAESVAQYGGNLTSDLYQRGMADRATAVGMTPMMYGMGLAPGQTTKALGEQQREERYTQQGMNQDRRAFNQNEPYSRLTALGGPLAQYAGLAGTSEGTSETVDRTEGSMLGTIMSLGSMGLGAFGGGSPLGALSGLGGLGGLGGSSRGASYGGGMPINSGLGNPWMRTNSLF